MKGGGEAGPTGSALELASGAEQRQPAKPARIGALPFFREKTSAEGRFLATIEQEVTFILAERRGETEELIFRGRPQVKGAQAPRSIRRWDITRPRCAWPDEAIIPSYMA